MQYLTLEEHPIDTHIAQFPKDIKRDGVVNWIKPQEDTIKVTVDAALFEDKSAYGFGFTARDSTGKLVQARTVRQWEVEAPDKC